MLNWLRRTWMLLLIIVGTMVYFGDAAMLATTLFSLSAVALVLLLADFILDNRDKWGLFPSLDIDKAIFRACCHPLGAGLVVVAVLGLLVAILFLSVPIAHGAQIPAGARQHLPTLSAALYQQWPSAPLRQIPAGQVEQESSWKERATLHTSRELGRGLVQMTIAYDKTGRERFNIYRDAVRTRQLAAWDWQSDPYNPRAQLTFLVLQDRSNFVMVRKYSVDDLQAWKCSLVCYNAGSGRWLQRRANAKRLGISADRWDNGLDRAYSGGETGLLYGRPLYQAVNEYPRVICKRAEKYRGLV